jgi:hypothetical protein
MEEVGEDLSFYILLTRRLIKAYNMNATLKIMYTHTRKKSTDFNKILYRNLHSTL